MYPNKWRVHGRSDDQIMLSTGEKVRSSRVLFSYKCIITHIFSFMDRQTQDP